jgi:hypothetical protein
MASSGKKKTTMAKLTRENRLRERRLDKQARKDARKLAASLPPVPETDPFEVEGEGEGEGDEVRETVATPDHQGEGS